MSEAEQSEAKLLELLCAPKVLGPRGGAVGGGWVTNGPQWKSSRLVPPASGHPAYRVPVGTCAGRPLARVLDGESWLLSVEAGYLPPSCPFRAGFNWGWIADPPNLVGAFF